jgi:glutamate-5-semialdehyde dehydrogenase
MSDIVQIMQQMGRQAAAAARVLRLAPAKQRASAIELAANAIAEGENEILQANQLDLQAANQLPASFIDRMQLSPARIADMVAALRAIAAQEDPVGRELERWQQPNGLRFRKVAVPLGVIGIIYESRPNVTADAAALCLRSANAVILRGGSDALQTSWAIFQAVQAGAIQAGLPEHSVQFVNSPDRAAVGALLQGLDGHLDLVIPRGGKSLVGRVQREAKVPVLSHLEGICHVYVHRDADSDMAVEVAKNAKMRRVGVCGAAECLLIDQACAPSLLPKISDALINAGCELRGDETACALDGRMKPASEEDWGKEFLAPILAVRVVADIEQALSHIEQYGSGHTDSIITQTQAIAHRFQREVDSAIVLHNASTQFADGGEFGFGAEIGIATGKLHARGPVGAAHLTSYQYQVDGDGQIRPLG